MRAGDINEDVIILSDSFRDMMAPQGRGDDGMKRGRRSISDERDTLRRK